MTNQPVRKSTIQRFFLKEAHQRRIECTLPRRKETVSNSRFNGTFYEEARPVPGSFYFARATAASTATAVCLYNEEGPELSRTLDSLTTCPALDLVIIADGLEKLSASMREYLALTFAVPSEVFTDSPPAWLPNEQAVTLALACAAVSCMRQALCMLMKRLTII